MFPYGKPLTSRLDVFGHDVMPVPVIEQPPFGAVDYGNEGLPERQFAVSPGEMMARLAEQAESEERNHLMAELANVHERVTVFITVKQEEHRESLRGRLDEVLKQGRKAHDRAQALLLAGRDLEVLLHEHEPKLAAANVALMKATADKPDPEEWPSASEIAASDRRIAAAQAKLNRAESELTKVRDEMKAKYAAARQAQQEEEALREERDGIRAELAGKRAPGPFGLTGANKR